MKPRWKNLYEGAYCLNDHGPAGEVSMFLLDEENHAAFTGDNLCRSIWLSLPESVSVAEYQTTLEYTLSVMQEKDILWNYSAHKLRKENIQDVIHRFLQCCDAILTGRKRPRFMDFGMTSGNFVGKAGRYILYRDKTCFESH